MNRQAAINLMMRGPQIKITHQYFSPDEYIYMIDGEIYDENDYRMKCNEPNGHITFWTDRTGPEWEEGWSIYKTDADKLLEADEEIFPITPNPIGYEGRYYSKPSSPIYKSKNSHKRTNKKH